MSDLDFSEYYNENTDEYEVPKDEFDNIIELIDIQYQKLMELNKVFKENKELRQKLIIENKKLKEQL